MAAVNYAREIIKVTSKFAFDVAHTLLMKYGSQLNDESNEGSYDSCLKCSAPCSSRFSRVRIHPPLRNKKRLKRLQSRAAKNKATSRERIILSTSLESKKSMTATCLLCKYKHIHPLQRTKLPKLVKKKTSKPVVKTPEPVEVVEIPKKPKKKKEKHAGLVIPLEYHIEDKKSRKDKIKKNNSFSKNHTSGLQKRKKRVNAKEKPKTQKSLGILKPTAHEIHKETLRGKSKFKTLALKGVVKAPKKAIRGFTDSRKSKDILKNLLKDDPKPKTKSNNLGAFLNTLL